jgi:hypothetical protein
MNNLPRWIFASVASHFKTIADNNNIPYFVEGIDEREPDNMRQSRVEIRVTGPKIKEVSKDYYRIEVTINFLLTYLMQMTGSDAYEIMNWCGIFSNEMLEPIPVYRYGSGAEDDDSLVGCLRIKKNRTDSVKTFHFGQVHKTDRVRQSELDAVYEMDVENI